jgi:hypothetical protein
LGVSFKKVDEVAQMEATRIDLSWFCIVAVMVVMIPVIYYGTRSRLKYAKELFNTKPRDISRLSKLITRKAKTRFTKLEEFYAAINTLIEWLKRDGYPQDAAKLDTLMHTPWTTGSELLGELMLALKSMKGGYSPELRKEIDECFEFALHHRKILGLSDDG